MRLTLSLDILSCTLDLQAGQTTTLSLMTPSQVGFAFLGIENARPARPIKLKTPTVTKLVLINSRRLLIIDMDTSFKWVVVYELTFVNNVQIAERLSQSKQIKKSP
jgi:hypothetical protein